jgi:large subunit ribosomal protein L15
MANELSNLHPAPGETRARMRLGRGEGSGKGKTAGKGTKGQQARSGYNRRPNFEGGQTPLRRRIPKQGFTNVFAKDFEAINVERLAELDAGSVVTAESLKASGLVSRVGADGVKILGRGDLGVALHVRVAKLTRSAADKVLAAGGTVEGPLPGE